MLLFVRILLFFSRRKIDRILARQRRWEVFQKQNYKRLIFQFKLTKFGRLFPLPNFANFDHFVRRIPIQSYEEIDYYILYQARTSGPIFSFFPVQQFFYSPGFTGKRKIIPYTKESFGDFNEAILIYVRYLIEIKGFHPRNLVWDLSQENEAVIHWVSNRIAFFRGHEVKKFRTFSDVTEVVRSLKKPMSLVLRAPAPFYLELLQKGASHFEHVEFLICFTEGIHKKILEGIREVLPNLNIISRPVICTEMPVLIPFNKDDDCLLYLGRSFVEFLDAKGESVPMGNLNFFADYDLAITAPSGLTRYRLGEKVTFCKRIDSVPCFEYAGADTPRFHVFGENFYWRQIEHAFVEKNFPPKTVVLEARVMLSSFSYEIRVFVEQALSAREHEIKTVLGTSKGLALGLFYFAKIHLSIIFIDKVAMDAKRSQFPGESMQVCHFVHPEAD